MSALASGSRNKSWRDAEAAVFGLILDLLDGQVPGLDGRDDDDVRRLGYLAAATRHLLGCETRSVADLEAAAWVRLRSPPAPADGHARLLPLIRGSSAGRPDLDVLAAHWGISPGLDLGRFRSEQLALACSRREDAASRER